MKYSIICINLNRYNLGNNEWQIIAHLPRNICYPKVIPIEVVKMPWLLISGHESCDINSKYKFYVFHYLAFTIQSISHLSIDKFWNPMVEIIDDRISVFGGLERIKDDNDSLILTGNVLHDIWCSESLYDLLNIEIISAPSTTTSADELCEDYYDGYIVTPIEVIHPCNETDLVDLILNLLDIIHVVYQENGIIDVFVTQKVANKKYKYCGDAFLNIITCFHVTDEANILNITSSPNFPTDVVTQINRTITVYVHVKNITIVYINNVGTTDFNRSVVEDDDIADQQVIECVDDGNYNYYVFLVLIGIVILFAILIIADIFHTAISHKYHCECCNKCGFYKSDTMHTRLLSIIMLRICDLGTDIFLAIEIVYSYVECNDIYNNNPFSLLFVLSIATISCVVIPWFINVLTMIKITKLTDVVIDRPTLWFNKYMLFYVFLVVITGDCYTSTKLISSNLFALSIFDSGLNIVQYGSIRYTEVTTIIFEV